MWELGLLDEFLARPHDEITELAGVVDDVKYPFVDFTHLPTHCKFLAFMPQWDFLNFLAEQGKRYAGFRVLMETEATSLIREGDRVAGVRTTSPHGESEIRAELTIGADGRSSRLRKDAGLTVRDFGAPMDALWLRLPRLPTDPGQAFGFIKNGKILVLLGRQGYWQCAVVIGKGTFAAQQARGLPAFRQEIADQAPFVAGRVDAIQSWDDVKLLTVQVDRLERWYQDGLLFIGDAAHAMSPIGGVGINLAIQDAVAAANILYPALATGRAPDLAAVQKRRTFPTVMTQRGQLLVQNRVISKILQPQPAPGTAPKKQKRVPFLELFRRFPALRRIPARLVGVGFRPEHIETPAV